MLCLVYVSYIRVGFVLHAWADQLGFSASKEDADRAVQLKNGSVVGGRTIRVKPALRRLPLEHRRSKATSGEFSFS